MDPVAILIILLWIVLYCDIGYIAILVLNMVMDLIAPGSDPKIRIAITVVVLILVAIAIVRLVVPLMPVV